MGSYLWVSRFHSDEWMQSASWLVTLSIAILAVLCFRYTPESMSDDGPVLKKHRHEEDSSLWREVFTQVKPRLEKDGSLEELVVETFKKGGFKIGNVDVLPRMVSKISAGYNSTPYHNFGHATHVFMNSFVLLEGSRVTFTPVERAAMLFSAIIHDLGHEGVPNAQLVKEDHPLAAKYSNLSVAENFSVDEGLSIIEEEEYNIFGEFSVGEMVRFKDLVKSIVLATDIGNQSRVKKIYSDIEEAVNVFSRSEKDGDDHENSVKLDSNDEGNRINLLCLMMKLSDVGSTFQHVNTSKHWIHNFYSENKAANNKGRGPEVDAQGFLDGQEKFFNSYIKHLHSVVASTGMLSPAFIAAMEDNFQTLVGVWGNESSAMLAAWNKETT